MERNNEELMHQPANMTHIGDNLADFKCPKNEAK
jgi:hypothetical protein